MKKIIYVLVVLITISFCTNGYSYLIDKNSNLIGGCISGNCGAGGYGVLFYPASAQKMEGTFLKEWGDFNGFGITTNYTSTACKVIHSISRSTIKWSGGGKDYNTCKLISKIETLVSFDEEGNIVNIYSGNNNIDVDIHKSTNKVYITNKKLIKNNEYVKEEKTIEFISTAARYYSDRITVYCTDGTELVFNLDGSMFIKKH